MALDASTLVTTVGGASSNSYVSLSAFTTYCEQRLSVSAFDGAEPDDKIRALLMAAKQLDREDWLGERVTTTQALSWPRCGAPKQDADSWGTYYLTTEIPQAVKDAQCELALAYLGGYGTSTGNGGITEFSVDGLSIKAGSSDSNQLPDAAMDLIGGLVRGNRLMRA